MRGKVSMESKTIHGLGSPPPMRGKEADGDTFEAVLRITPAYAGKRGHSMK